MSVLADEHLGVVVVDDDPVFRDLICATVAKKSKFVMFEAASGAELFDVLKLQRIDCIVLDYDLGAETGLAIKQRIDESYPDHPPTIMMTGDGRQSTAIKAFRMGVDDYLPKSGLRPESVVSSVLNAVERDRQVSLAKAEHRRLVAAAAVDIVTGLEGRSRLDERLTHLASLPPTARSSYALIMVDLVEYPAILERFGLKTADRALRHFSKTLQLLTRPNDVYGRYQDATFIIIADVRADPTPLDQICRRLSDGLSLPVSFDAANLVLSARVAGSLCSSIVDTVDAKVGDLLRQVKSDLGRAEGFKSSSRSTDQPAARQPLQEEDFRLPVTVVLPEQALPPSTDALRTTDRRREARQRVFKRGLIHVVGKQATINCNVRNLSPSGANLRLEAPCAVPSPFDLEVVGSGERRRVRVCWHVAKDLGVEFIG